MFSSNQLSARTKPVLPKKSVDGRNPKQRQAWLWVGVTPLVTFFQITLSRCSETARNLLGESFGGILTSDRHGAYNWVDLEQRQLCWAHSYIKSARMNTV